LRQVLDAAVAWEYLARNPAKATGKNTKPIILERVALEPADLDKLAGERRSPYDVAIVVGMVLPAPVRASRARAG
jgi:hypothetical protein